MLRGLLLLLAMSSTACASQVVNGYLRGRPLGPGHVETGVSLSWARQPTSDVAFRADEVEAETTESVSPIPAPVGHFRMGVTERIDAGLDVSFTGAALSGKFAIFDADAFMMSVVGRVGSWSGDIAGEGPNGLRTGGSFEGVLALPLAIRPAPWIEIVITPNVGMLTVDATRYEIERLPSADLVGQAGTSARSFVTAHAGFALGASFAVWRVRINPEINVVSVLRPDHDKGFFAAYPGVAAFFVY